MHRHVHSSSVRKALSRIQTSDAAPGPGPHMRWPNAIASESMSCAIAIGPAKYCAPYVHGQWRDNPDQRTHRYLAQREVFGTGLSASAVQVFAAFTQEAEHVTTGTARRREPAKLVWSA